jgi:hypothetical protein
MLLVMYIMELKLTLAYIVKAEVGGVLPGDKNRFNNDPMLSHA